MDKVISEFVHIKDKDKGKYYYIDVNINQICVIDDHTDTIKLVNGDIIHTDIDSMVRIGSKLDLNN